MKSFFLALSSPLLLFQCLFSMPVATPEFSSNLVQIRKPLTLKLIEEVKSGNVAEAANLIK